MATTKNYLLTNQFNKEVGEALTAIEGTCSKHWSKLKESIHTTAMSIFGRSKKKSEDWFL